MKYKIATFSALLALSFPASAQKVGDTVTPEVFAKLDWIQGEAPGKWEAGKPYIIDCWATWCGPCIAAIPHLDALYDKFEPQGLRVIAVNVKEDGKDRIGQFVKKRGDDMSYPIAFDGKGGAFETEWLKPAEAPGLPHAFVVMDGKVLFNIHPARLTDEVIEQLLAGPESVAKVSEEMVAAANLDIAILKQRKAFAAAARKRDIEGMRAAVAELEKIPEAAGLIPQLQLSILMSSGDWAGATAKLEAMKPTPSYPMMLSSVVSLLSTPNRNAPEEFRKFVTTSFQEVLQSAKIHPLQFTQLARLQWINGDEKAAAVSAQRQIELLKEPGSEKFAPLIGPCEQFAGAVKEGTMPSERELYGWIRKSQEAAEGAGPES